MRTSRQGLENIARREGLRLRMYKDSAGLPTIGVGHLITPAELGSGVFAHGISSEQAMDLLADDVAEAESAIFANVHPPAGRELSQDQIDALVSLVFNIGAGAFRSSSLLRDLNAGAPDEAIVEDIMKWNKIHVDGKLVADPALASRRVEESAPWRNS